MKAREIIIAASLLLFALPAAAAEDGKGEEASVSAGSGSRERARVSADGTVIRSSSKWRGSWVSYDHVHTTVGLDKGAELTWNPYYAHSLSIAPRYALSDEFFLSADLTLEQELTDSDWTTKKHEVIWSDPSIVVGWYGWAEPQTGIRITPTLRISLPLSKVSQAATQILAVTPSVRLSRSFNDVLGGLYVAWAGTWTQRFHEETTVVTDASGVVGCESADTCAAADRLANTGYLNAWGDLSTGPSMVLTLAPGLRFNADMRWTKSFLYDSADPRIDVMGREQEVESSPYTRGFDGRYGTYFGLGLAYDLLDSLTVTGAVYTPSPQLDQEGQRHSPFFNRYTRVGISLGFDVDTLSQRLFSGS